MFINNRMDIKLKYIYRMDFYGIIKIKVEMHILGWIYYNVGKENKSSKNLHSICYPYIVHKKGKTRQTNKQHLQRKESN